MKHNLNTITEIKAAVDAGKTVYVNDKNSVVIKDKFNQYFINYAWNNNSILLHGRAGTKYENQLNGKDFYYEEVL